MGAGYLLQRVIGQGRAAELLLLGSVIDAQTADRYGLATRLVAPEHVDCHHAPVGPRCWSGSYPLGRLR